MHTPTEIKLLQKSKMLDITFEDGTTFYLPCEYLRVFSPAAEKKPVFGKQDVNITAIDPVGQYAIKLVFDDGHDTGIFSWDYLYTLGEKKDENLESYLAQVKTIGELGQDCPSKRAAQRAKLPEQS